MPNSSGALAQVRVFFWSDPLLGLAVAAALIALATTPIAFALLGRLNYLQTRRGRTFQKPTFLSIVCGMLLVMGLPAIFLALVVKSRHFDEDRYEFDPNRQWSVLDQGRGFRSLQEADEAVRREMDRLAEERKDLVDRVKKLDEAMLPLRASAVQSPGVAQALPPVLERLADVRRAVGVDAPQQLQDFTAPPADLPPSTSSAPTVVAIAPTIPPRAAPPGGGLTPAEVEAELASVPEPQRPIAAMLPLTDLPEGWTVGRSGTRHLETFNAENLYEKIDGRAESFLQYDVKGMAYTYYHPIGDESAEVQLYIFEMGSSLKALGKYSSEKPEDASAQPIGDEGYTAAGSTLFHAGPYYTQMVSTQDDPKFTAFSLALAERIAAEQKAATSSPGGGPARGSPEAILALLPAEPGRSGAKYVAQDVFGYSFLSDVFMADYAQEDVTWQGFLRPYESPSAAQAVFQDYLDTAQQDGAEVQEVQAEGADQMVISSNIGLIDVIFRKGNVLAGANGSTESAPAEDFARSLARSLPADVPPIEGQTPSSASESQEDPEGRP